MYKDVEKIAAEIELGDLVLNRITVKLRNYGEICNRCVSALDVQNHLRRNFIMTCQCVGYKEPLAKAANGRFAAIRAAYQCLACV